MCLGSAGHFRLLLVKSGAQWMFMYTVLVTRQNSSAQSPHPPTPQVSLDITQGRRPILHFAVAHF